MIYKKQSIILMLCCLSVISLAWFMISHQITPPVQAQLASLDKEAHFTSSQQTQVATDTVQIASDVQPVLQKLDKARVVVALRPVPEVGIAQAQEEVIFQLASAEFDLVYRYQTLPGLVGEIDEDALDILKENPNILAVALDAPVQAALGESSNLIQADQVHTDLGLTGAGVTVAVLDTGIDASHPDLNDHLVAQKCFNRGTCPPNSTDESDNARDDNGHGTHVAGIITGKGDVSGAGIAPDAGLVAVRVLNGSGSGWASDIVAGIDWITANQSQFDIRVANLSLTSGLYNGACDTANANTLNFASAIEAARNAGIITFAASGNEAQTNEMGAPACTTSTVSVGSVYDTDVGLQNWSFCVDNTTSADTVSCFSNSSSILDLLAPGSAIESAAIGGGSVSQSGTSMAAPHAAAVAALMLEADPNLSLDDILTILRQTGRSVVDTRNQRVTARIDALAALNRVLDQNGTVIVPTETPTPVPMGTPIPTNTPEPTATPTDTPIPPHTPTPTAITAAIRFDPADVVLPVGHTITLQVQVHPAINFTEAALEIAFDPNLLEVVDADETTEGIQVKPSPRIMSRAQNLVQNGVISIAFIVDDGAIDGQQTTLFEVTWQGSAAGQASLDITQAQLVSASDQPIAVNTERGTIVVSEASTSVAALGSVLLQGRTIHQGIGVTVSPQACPSVANDVSFAPIEAENAQMIETDNHGRFNVTTTNNTVYGCLQAAHPGYLPGQNNTPQGDLGLLILRAGDMNDDYNINIFDLALVAAEYNNKSPLADINANGTVDIFDLAIIAGNFDISGAATDWVK